MSLVEIREAEVRQRTTVKTGTAQVTTVSLYSSTVTELSVTSSSASTTKVTAQLNALFGLHIMG